MKAIRIGNLEVSNDRTRRSAAPRPRVRRDPRCEILEGRRLLTTTAGAVSSGVPVWGSWNHSTTAETAHFGGEAKHGTGHWSADSSHSGDTGSFTPRSWSPGDEAGLRHASK